ncbi:APC family permease [Olivibacter domesticus]|uniref:Amino acid transporter n=1 Tax=Olivibacter domesticus TaxID=407022 RepID=A0A1H7J1K4_OLID1|nr:amino acid permease [Olivibacter domesticus]SEK67727.1 Amino acid transporter [Olivibacter domesticus]
MIDVKKSTNENIGEPKKILGSVDAISIIVGIVIGAGVFKTPALVAANTSNDSMFLLSWLLGGAVSLSGALSYAELTSAYPHTGGDYHFLYRAYGKRLAFLFAWARMTVIQTGSIALLAFIFSDYASQIYTLGPYTEVIYASGIIVLLTFVNILGIKIGTGTQKIFTLMEVTGILLVIVAGLFFTTEAPPSPNVHENTSSFMSNWGMAMVFVLLTYGGWNEAAYVSAEMKSGSRSMAFAMIASILIITIVYILVNYAYIYALGHQGVANSKAVAADLVQLAWGGASVKFIGLLVAISALTSANATIITGARSNYAVGNDFSHFATLGKWNNKVSSPVNALILQAIISLMLIALGVITRHGFETIVEYTAPVFWFFFLLVGLAVLILRVKDPSRNRPFKVPFYPFMPLVFCLSSGFLLLSSVLYTGKGALLGIGVLMVGLLFVLFVDDKSK